MKPISQILEIQIQDRGIKKKHYKTKWLTFLAQYVKSQLELIMEQFVASNVIHGSIQDAIISVKKTYRCLKNDPAPWYCKLYTRAKLPFSKLNNTELARLTKIEP